MSDNGNMGATCHECAQCGRELDWENAEVTDEYGHAFCSEECAEAWEHENFIMENAED
jgi:endogenous inhibitor of DNA gyrase (YacG/DUF329 family)